jgi:hypothetical protein
VGIRFFADDISTNLDVENASAEESRLLFATLWDGIAV